MGRCIVLPSQSLLLRPPNQPLCVPLFSLPEKLIQKLQTLKKVKIQYSYVYIPCTLLYPRWSLVREVRDGHTYTAAQTKNTQIHEHKLKSRKQCPAHCSGRGYGRIDTNKHKHKYTLTQKHILTKTQIHKYINRN